MRSVSRTGPAWMGILTKVAKSYDFMTINRKMALGFSHIFNFNTNDSIFHMKELLTDQKSILDYWSVNKWKQVEYSIIGQIPNNKLYWFQLQ